MKSKLVKVALCVLSVIGVAFMPVLANAQGRSTQQPQVLRNPNVNVPARFSISPPLAQLASVPFSQPGAPAVRPILHPKGQPLAGAASQLQGSLTNGALQAPAGPLVSATVGLNLLGIGIGFPGYSVPDAPTDTNLAVGDTQVVQWVNVSYAVFDKTTGAVIAGPTLGNALWAALGGACSTSNSGDPIVQWDKIAHRWVLTQPVFSSPFMTCVAVSQTADATGSYYLYAFPQTAGFPDYPKWGLMPDAYYQSQNIFNAAGTAYLGVEACAYNRTKLLAGDPTAEQICFLDNSNGTLFDDSLLPADLDSASTPPPTGQDEVFLGSIDNYPSETHIYEYLFHADFTTPANSTFTGINGSMPITVAGYSLACGGGACIPQPNTTTYKLDSLGDRLMYRLAYRNFSGDHQTWLVNHSVTAGTSVGAKWYEFQAPENSTALSVYQEGVFAPDSNYRWMGSIAMDAAQDIVLGYSLSSSAVFPSIYYTGRVPGDALGTMESEAAIIDGTGSQLGTSNRWGDYTSMALDAEDDCTFWYTNQYYVTTTQFAWSTRLASIRFPGCPATSDFSISASPASQTVVQGNSTQYTVTGTPLNGYTGSLTLSISGLPSGANGTFGPNPLAVSSPNASNSTLTVSTSSSTPPGTYTLTITGTDANQVAHTTTVTLVVNPIPPDFSITAKPGSRVIRRGASADYRLYITFTGGFSGTITFGVSGLPTGANGSFTPPSVTAPGTYMFDVTTSASTPLATSMLTITGTSGALSHSTTVSLKVH